MSFKSFGHNSYTSGIPAVSSFDDAVKAWQKIKPLRNSRASDPRPIGRRESRNPKQVRVKLDPATGEPVRIVFRYRHTDVVTWHKDNTCVLDPYPSRSTATFAKTLLPRGVYIHGECYSVEVNLPMEAVKRGEPVRRCYALNGQPLTLQVTDTGHAVPLPDAEQPDGTKPVGHITIDVKAANALYRRYRLKEFETFYAAFMMTSNYKPTLGDSKIDIGRRYWWDGDLCSPDEALRLLKETRQDQWPTLARVVATTCAFRVLRVRTSITPMRVLRWLVRGAHRSKAFRVTSVPYASSHEQLRRIVNTDPTKL